MTVVKCLSCGSDQDFEVAVGYCEECGQKLPVPHVRGKTTARSQFLSQKKVSEVGTTNVVVTAALALAGLAGLGAIVVLIVQSQM
jgi:hypothetical protein